MTIRHLRFVSVVLAAIYATGNTACAASKPPALVETQATDTMELANLQVRFGQIASRVTPSIVAISAVTSESATKTSLMLNANINGPRLAAALDRVSRTVGTGFFLDDQGYILTAEHVVANAEQLWITTDDQKVYPAMVVGSDPRSDLAVLKISATGQQPVKFAPADSVKRGQWALTLGNPYGLATSGELAMSVGVVAATNRSLPRLSAQENRLYTNLIQTTAEINPGNSGGPLFDMDGRVIGINAAVVLPQKNTNGIGFSFAVTDELLGKVNQLKNGEAVKHAYLGVSISNTFVSGRNGARIDTIASDGPAGGSGLAVGDVVVKINDAQITDTDTFARAVSSLPITKPAILRVIRDGDTRNISLTPMVRVAAPTAVCRMNQRLYWGGIVLSPAGASGYIVKSVAATSPLSKQGIQPGMIITGVHGKKAATLLEMLNLLDGTSPDECKLDCAGNVDASATAAVS